MNARSEQGARRKRMPLRHVLAGTGLMLVVTLVQVAISRMEPMTFERALLMLAVSTGSAFGMAVLLAPIQPFPRWAWFGSAGVFGLTLIVSLLLATNPAEWTTALRPSMWMVPWFHLALASSSARRAGDCAPEHPGSGWFLMGITVVLGFLILILPVVA